MPGGHTGLPPWLPWPFEARVGDVRVRSLPFSLEGDVDEPGHRFTRKVKVLGDELLEAQMQWVT